jgi:hypothetical protein
MNDILDDMYNKFTARINNKIIEFNTTNSTYFRGDDFMKVT